jgi:hypothetical protein
VFVLVNAVMTTVPTEFGTSTVQLDEGKKPPPLRAPAALIAVAGFEEGSSLGATPPEVVCQIDSFTVGAPPMIVLPRIGVAPLTEPEVVTNWALTLTAARAANPIKVRILS